MKSTHAQPGYAGFFASALLALACGSDRAPNPSNPGAGGTGGTSGTSSTSGSGGMNAVPPGGGQAGGGTTPQGGSASGGGGADNGGSSGGAGSSGGSGVAGGGGDDTITAPEGKVPNMGMPPGMIDLDRDDWRTGLVSPTLEEGHHQNQPIMINGYVEGAGNAEIVFYDISDPTTPQVVSRLISPNFDPKAGPKGVGEAESHQTSVARYGNKFYQVLTGGTGVDIFDVSDVRKLRHVKLVELPNVNYGDFTEAVWGMYWQGSVIYVGGTNTGLHILDAKDPENISLVKTIPTSQFGGISAGPLWAVGNILVITTPKESGGIATMDISDPFNPIPLSAIKPSTSYIGGFYGRYAWLQMPLRVWDVLTDPLNIGTANAPLATLQTEASEYVTFSDGILFLGHLRPNAGLSKIDVRDVTNLSVQQRIWGRLEFTNGDDQFSLPIGGLVVLADDEQPYRGMVIAAHSTEPDTTPPSVDSVVPKDGATGQSRKSRIGLSLTDNIEIATVHPGSVVVRPVGGQPIRGSFGLYMTVLNFDPDEDLMPNTTYEVLLSKDGVKDLVGNGIANEFKSTFTTGP